ncbi:hypothetical protein F8388_017904 [Cannabis sativa]|uniref:UDP-N-acetylglucosamine transferase subunit ALG14 n=1 Tax=Cannabis sativa TaxID=3483 RepID=A0A7J6F3Z0_CANSA|nr:hypothetical protein F8388_017904 [Cannabis sativa]
MSLVVVISLLTIGVVLIRVIYVICQSGKSLKGKRSEPVSTLIVLGSGTRHKVAETSQFMQSIENPLQWSRDLHSSLRNRPTYSRSRDTLFHLFLSLLYTIIGIRWSSIFYVESIARVQRLSLSGLILYKLTFLISSLCNGHSCKKKYPRSSLCWMSNVV